MNAIILGLLGAASMATGALLTKGMVDRLPPLQLIGPLYLCNAAWLFPLIPFVSWHWSIRIAVLHIVSVLIISGTALAIFRLYVYGKASSVTTAQATSPLPTLLVAALLVPADFRWVEAAAAVLVVAGVVWAVSNSFAGLGKPAAIFTAAAGAIGTGMTTIMSQLLLDEGAELVEIYVVRTVIAGLLFTIAAPPRGIPARQWPMLGARSFFITAGFSLSILGLTQGSPSLIQTMLATMPLFVILEETVASRKRPSLKVTGAAVLVAAAVALVSL